MSSRIKKRKVPKFVRIIGPNRKVKPSIDPYTWRKPRGRYSNKRKKLKEAGPIPCIGYRQPKAVRGLHPSGYKEVLVHNVKELEKIDPKTEAARIASQVGLKKRLEIMKKAKELGIKILNPVRGYEWSWEN